MKLTNDQYEAGLSRLVDDLGRAMKVLDDTRRQRAAVTREQFIAVQAVLMCFYNVSSDQDGGVDSEPSVADFLREQNPDVHPSYVEEKCALWRKSPAAFFGALDHERAVEFIKWSVTKFGKDAGRRWDANEGNQP